MTTLSQSPSADGIRDVMEDLNSNGGGDAVPINGDYISDRFTRINGSANTSATTSDTATKQYADARSTFAFKAGATTWQVGSGKSAVNHSASGWGTSSGIQGATNNGSSTQIGTAYDGSSSYTSSGLAVSGLDSGFESNKNITFIGYFGPIGGTKVALCFAGSNAGTGDSDWDNLYLKMDLTGSTGGTDMSGGQAGFTYARSSATVASQYSNIVYTWDLSIGDVAKIAWDTTALSGLEANTFVSIR